MKIRLFAHLKDKFGSSELEVLLESNMKVKDLREALLKNYSINTSNSMCAVNMVYVEDSYSIDKNDEIAFIPPVSGGSSEDFVEITKNEILPDNYSPKNKSLRFGSELTFLGISRDHNDNKTVKSLFYECYEDMAYLEIKKLIAVLKEKWDIGPVKVIHRVGQVNPGRISLLVIITSVHRSESLESMKYFLDEFKTSVPIWKKEIYADDFKWIEN
jgi:molybdopterin synthase catalytic subunit